MENLSYIDSESKTVKFTTRDINDMKEVTLPLADITMLEKIHAESYTTKGDFKKWNPKFYITVNHVRYRCLEGVYTELVEAIGMEFVKSKSNVIAYKNNRDVRSAVNWTYRRKELEIESITHEPKGSELVTKPRHKP